MIQTFKHKGLKNLFEDDDRSGIQPAHADKLLDILDRLDAATHVQDMRYPGSGLHQLQGDRKGEWSVTVSKNWRVIFTFQDGDAYDVNYEDYHSRSKMVINKRKPTHPGGLIKRQYLEPLNMTITDLAEILGVSRKTLSEIVNEQARVTPNMALCLAMAFQTTPELWLNLQQKYDLWCTAHESDAWKEISPIDCC